MSFLHIHFMGWETCENVGGRVPKENFLIWKNVLQNWWINIWCWTVYGHKWRKAAQYTGTYMQLLHLMVLRWLPYYMAGKVLSPKFKQPHASAPHGLIHVATLYSIHCHSVDLNDYTDSTCWLIKQRKTERK